MSGQCEVLFLDVGQASCNVILFGKKRGIVIDCARTSDVPMRVLTDYVEVLEVLALTHNDIDHVGGAATVISHYAERPGPQIWHLADRPFEDINLVKLIEEECRAGNLPWPRRLERGGSPTVIFDDPSN